GAKHLASARGGRVRLRAGGGPRHGGSGAPGGRCGGGGERRGRGGGEGDARVHDGASVRVRRGSGSARDDHAHRCRVETVAGVVDLGAVGDQHQGVGLGAQGDLLARRGQSVDDAEGAVGLHRHAHEPVDVGHQIPLAQAPFEGGGEEVLHTGVLVAGVVTVAQRVRLLRAGARDGVVVAHLVGDHGHQGGAVVGEQHAAGGQEDVALGGDGGLGAVAVGVVGGVVEQAVDRLIAV